MMASEAELVEDPATEGPPLVLAGHNQYIMSVASVCRETRHFVDVLIICSDGLLVSHKLLLASASQFLRKVMLETAADEEDAVSCLVFPEVSVAVMSTLLDFIYTGKMILAAEDVNSFYSLIDNLSINPESVHLSEIAPVDVVTIEEDDPEAIPLSTENIVEIIPDTTPEVIQETPIELPESSAAEIESDKIWPFQKRRISTGSHKGHPHPAQKKQRLSLPATHSVERKPMTNGIAADQNVNRVNKLVKSDVSKKALKDCSNSTKKTVPMNESQKKIIFKDKNKRVSEGGENNANKKPARRSSVGSVNDASAKVKDRRQSASSSATVVNGSSEVPSGFHDLSRKDTWVCAICEFYDPPGIDVETTDWIGCDCNRWYHKHCTKLKKIDDSFSCKNVRLTCLPME